jgi:transcriptional regulator with XRE-family HTH domain
MNFTQMHDHLRLVLLRRIQRGTLSVSLLARQTGLAKAHLSNYLRSKRNLSLVALDRVLASQRLRVEDLVPATLRTADLLSEEGGTVVPLVSHAVALSEPAIRPSAVQTMVHLPAGSLKSVRAPRPPGSRRTWQRFVAVRIPSGDTLPMEPVVFSEAIVLIDRHYISFARYWPDRPNLYAVRHGSHLVLRYADFLAGRLVLRPHNILFPVDLIEVRDGQSPGDFLAGRVVLIVNET